MLAKQSLELWYRGIWEAIKSPKNQYAEALKIILGGLGECDYSKGYLEPTKG